MTIRAYRMPDTANGGKHERVAAVLPWWQRGMVHVQLIQVRRLRSGVRRLGWLSPEEVKSLPGYLSQRQWRSVVNQVNAALTSWQGLAVIGMRRLIAQADVPEDLRDELYLVNAYKAWWSQDTHLHTKKVRGQEVKITVSQEALDTAVALMAEYQRFCGGQFPSLHRTRTMLMDGPIAKVETAKDAHHAEYWVTVATTERGKPAKFPLHGYDYFDQAPGEVRNFAQVHITDDGRAELSLVRKSETVRPPVLDSDSEVLGLDWGLVNLLTTSEGDALGQRIYPWLQERDAELTELTRALQRSGIKPSTSRRYRRLQSRIRSYVRNEVGRILNRLVQRGYRHLVVENLDFRGGGLSRRMNRLIGRAGRGAVKDKLASLVDSGQATVHEVNPAYTSQECSGCEFRSASNRKSRDRFVCGFCGKKLPADVNAARINTKRRSLGDDGLVYVKREEIGAIIDGRFAQRWGIPAAEIRARTQRRGRSTAMSPS